MPLPRTNRTLDLLQPRLAPTVIPTPQVSPSLPAMPSLNLPPLVSGIQAGANIRVRNNPVSGFGFPIISAVTGVTAVDLSSIFQGSVASGVTFPTSLVGTVTLATWTINAPVSVTGNLANDWALVVIVYVVCDIFPLPNPGAHASVGARLRVGANLLDNVGFVQGQGFVSNTIQPINIPLIFAGRVNAQPPTDFTGTTLSFQVVGELDESFSGGVTSVQCNSVKFTVWSAVVPSGQTAQL